MENILPAFGTVRSNNGGRRAAVGRGFPPECELSSQPNEKFIPMKGFPTLEEVEKADKEQLAS